VQKEIIGADAVDALYAGAPEDQRHIQRYLSANCFGDQLNPPTTPAPVWTSPHASC
jgi:hypothetical protein